MSKNEIGKLTLNLNPEALKKIIADGRLLELADTVAREAANQISAQIVDHVARAAVAPAGIAGGVTAEIAYISGDEGGFGTHPPPRRWGVVDFNEVRANPMQVIAQQEG